MGFAVRYPRSVHFRQYSDGWIDGRGDGIVNRGRGRGRLVATGVVRLSDDGDDVDGGDNGDGEIISKMLMRLL